MENLANIFYELKSPSIKVDTRFANYEELLSKYRNKQPTLVEAGVLLGKSCICGKDILERAAE